MPHDDSASSQSLERGLVILGAFTRDRPALGISELAQRLDLTRNTTHRYVATLAKLGYLDQAGAAAGGRVQPGDVPPGANRETEIFRDDDAAEPLRHVVELKEWTSHAS